MSSYCGVLPVESDSHILIDNCLAKLRQDARLDEDPVLPTLDVILGKSSKQLVFQETVPALPSPTEIVRHAVKTPRRSAFPSDNVVLPAPVPAGMRIRRVTQAIARRMRWPVLLCGFVAGVFGGAALMKSPVGHKPAVQHVVKAAKTQARHAIAFVRR